MSNYTKHSLHRTLQNPKNNTKCKKFVSPKKGNLTIFHRIFPPVFQKNNVPYHNHKFKQLKQNAKIKNLFLLKFKTLLNRTLRIDSRSSISQASLTCIRATGVRKDKALS